MGRVGGEKCVHLNENEGELRDYVMSLSKSRQNIVQNLDDANNGKISENLS
jgi:hypothetical protein